jgi:hypothetical protein
MADYLFEKRKAMDLYYSPEEINCYLRRFYRKYPQNEKNIIVTKPLLCKNHHAVVATHKSPYKRPGVKCDSCGKKNLENEVFFFRCH